MEIVFLNLRYLGLSHNWDILNAFVFYGNWRQIVPMLKGVLMWQISLLEQVKKNINGLLVLHVGDSTCPTTFLVVSRDPHSTLVPL